MPSPADRERFDSTLKEVKKDFRGKMKDLEIDAIPMSIKWDRKDHRADDLGDLDKWGRDLVDDIAKEAERVFEEGGIDEAQEEEELMRVTKRAMTMAVERFGSVLGSFPEGEISDKVQVDEFWQRAAAVLWTIDEQALMLESAKQETGPNPVVLAFYKTIESQIPQDYTAVVERILENKVSPDDREYIADKFLRLLGGDSLTEVYSDSTRDIRTGEVALLMLNLNQNPDEKRKVIELITAKPGGAAAIMHLVVGDFISAAEGEEYIQRQLPRETDPDRIEAFHKALEFILGDTMRQVQETQTKAKKEIRERSRYIVGHKNQALAKLSYRGIGSMYIKTMAVGALGLMVMANWKKPGKMLTNPVTWSALAAGSIAAEIDPSDIGIWPRPGTHLAKLAQDKDQMEAGEWNAKFNAFHDDILANVTTAELYYNLVDRVRLETQKQLTNGVPLHQVDIKLEEMGVDYGKLPERFRTRSKKDIEKNFTEWTQTFFFEKGLNKPGEQQQKNYMNDLRKERKMDGVWMTYNLNNALS